MFMLHDHGETMDLVFEVIVEKVCAEHFADCFKHNYHCLAYVRETIGKDGYVVFADRIDSRLVHANFSTPSGEGVFANWKFETHNRRNIR